MIFADLAHGIVGGLLLGLGIGFLYLSVGFIADVMSGYRALLAHIVHGKFFHEQRFISLRYTYLLYALGLLMGAATYTVFVTGVVPQSVVSPARLFVGGVFVGIGATITGGSVISHGANAVMSFRSVAGLVSALFLAIVMATAYLTHQVFFS